MERSDVDQSARTMLAEALQQCERSRDANSNAWALRRALDDAKSSSAEPRQVEARDRVPAETGATLIHNFSNGKGLKISASAVNDTVMGGRSDSRMKSEAEGAVFEGNVTKRGGGGFASLKFEPNDSSALAGALRGKTGIAFNVRCLRGCKSWKFQLNEGYNATTWQADFVASNSSGVQRIPFSDFVPTWRGRPQGRAGLTNSSLEKICTFGFMLSFLTADGAISSDFEEGPFSLSIARVETY